MSAQASVSSSPSAPSPAAGGIVFVGCGLAAGAPERLGQAPSAARRREVVVAGRRVKTIDIHAHCAVPEALALQNLSLGDAMLRRDLDPVDEIATRLDAMDEQGIDMEVLSINPNWYRVADRDIADQIITIQNERLAQVCAGQSDRFTAFASVALQFPDQAAEQLQAGVKKYGLKGAAIGGNVAGAELSDTKFNPFWAKAEELGVLIFIHPQGDGAPSQLASRFKGNGYLSNVIGNPLETTIALSHLIFEGTLDRYPRLKICAAHAGGYLPSYLGRFDHGCPVRPDLCAGGIHGPIRKAPSEYARQMYYDTMVFRPEGVRHLIAEVGIDRLMIGTDYPYPWTKTAIDLILETPDLDDAGKRAILGGNAAALLGLQA